MAKLIDVHTHVQFPQFDRDRDEVIKRSFDAGVWIVNAGSDKNNSQKAVELANNYNEGVYAAVGQHPTDNKEGFDYDFFKSLARDGKVVGIGECGLDYFHSQDKDNQKEVFVRHIKLAKEVGKPLVIHCREAFPDLIEVLKSHKNDLNNPPGILHFFTGTIDDAKILLETGFYFTFGGLITFNRGLDEVINCLPLDKILLETDAPYVAPAPYRGKRNEPSYIIETAKKMAELKDVSFEEVCDQTTENTKNIFGI